MRYLILWLFLLAANTSSNAAFTYLDVYGAKTVAVPASFGTNVSFQLLQPVPFWVEPLFSQQSLTVTNVYTTTNILDQIVRWTVVQHLTDQVASEQVVVDRISESYTNALYYPSGSVLITNRISYKQNTWWPPVTYNRALEEEFINDSYSADMTESQFQSTVLPFGDSANVTNSISFPSGNPIAVANLGATSTYEKELIGIASNSLRIALGGSIYTNLDTVGCDTNFVNGSTINPLFNRIVSANFNDTNEFYRFTWNDVNTINNGYTNTIPLEIGGISPETNMVKCIILSSQGGVSSYAYFTTPALESGALYQCVDYTHENGYWPDRVNQVWQNVVTALQHKYGSTQEETSTSPVNYFYGTNTVQNTRFRAVLSGSKYVTWNINPESVYIVKVDPKRLLYSTQNHDTATYVRNTNCWVYGLDMTPCSPWNSTYKNERAGTLISPRHITFATHFQLATGSTIRFVTKDNTVVTRTITGKKSIARIFHPQGDYGGGWYEECDITVAVLDSDVPSTINYCRVLPKDFYRWLPTLAGVPVVWLDRQDVAWNACIRDYEYGLEWDTGRLGNNNTSTITYCGRGAHDRDSGNPIITFIGNTPVLLACFLYSDGGYDGYPRFYDAINQAMTDLGGGYQLDAVNLQTLGYFEYDTK